MTLSDIFEQLTYGELSQFSMGGAEGAQVRPEDYKRVISHINLGMQELHKRFWLSTGQIMVQLYDHIQVYKIDRNFAQTNVLSTELYKYVVDSIYNPFEDDLLKIEQLFDEQGCLLVLNDSTDPCSFYTPSYNTIQVPLPYAESAISVQYRRGHSKIIYTPDIDPTKIEVEVPIGLLEALLIYVGGRVAGVLHSDQGNEGNQYLQRFEVSCQKAKDLGLEVTPNLTNMKLDCRGWV